MEIDSYQTKAAIMNKAMEIHTSKELSQPVVNVLIYLSKQLDEKSIVELLDHLSDRWVKLNIQTLDDAITQLSSDYDKYILCRNILRKRVADMVEVHLLP